MNLIYLLISISSFLDAYYEDENEVMVVVKYALAVFSLFPILQDITYGLRRPEVLSKLVVRRTIEYIVPGYWEHLFKKDRNAFERLLCRHFICGDIDGGMNYRFIEGNFLTEDYEVASNKYEYDNIKTMQVSDLDSFADLSHKDVINFIYNGDEYRCRLENTDEDQVLHSFKLKNGKYINFVDHESEWAYYYGISEHNLGFEFLNSPHNYILKIKGKYLMADLYHRLHPIEKIEFLKGRIGNTAESAVVQLNTQNKIMLKEIVEDEYDIDLFNFDGRMGWVM